MGLSSLLSKQSLGFMCLFDITVNNRKMLSIIYTVANLKQFSEMGSDSSSKWLGYSKILEPKEVFIQNGSPLLLRCEISLMLTHNFSLDVWWLHEDTQILVQVSFSSFL